MDLLSRLVVAIDRRQRRRLGIWEFSDDPACILRLALSVAHARVELADGTVVRPGQRVGVVHLWNERMPQIPPTGPGLAWAKAFNRRLVHSFRLLARYVATAPALEDIEDIRAFGGELCLAYSPGVIRWLRRLGVEVFDPVPLHGPIERTVDLGARLWVWLLRRAFNPESARHLRLSDLRRRPVWFSRRTLIALHGPGDSAPS
jgi:hypothetical protein